MFTSLIDEQEVTKKVKVIKQGFYTSPFHHATLHLEISDELNKKKQLRLKFASDCFDDTDFSSTNSQYVYADDLREFAKLFNVLANILDDSNVD